MKISPWLLTIPVGGAVLYFLLRPKSDDVKLAIYAPLPAPVAVAPMGSRAQSYMMQLDAAIAGWRALPVTKTLALGTLLVVTNMAQGDLNQGGITPSDLVQINAKAAAIQKEIG